MRKMNLVIGGVSRSRRVFMQPIVPVNSKGMKDSDPEVRSATARAMLARRYETTPKFQAKCGYPPCQNEVEGYDRRGKRKTYCSQAHNTAACRLRQRERGLVRRTRNGKVRLEPVDRGG